MDSYESPVERAIREATERGDFDNLPGAGKPLPGLGETHDPDWWIKALIEREHLDIGSVLPPALALRKEAEGFPQSLLGLGTEAGVRAVLDDFNRRVKLDRLRPSVGRFPAPIARTVDIDEIARQWRELKAAQRRRADTPYMPTAAPHTPEPPRQARRRGRFARLLHRVVAWTGMAG